MMSGNYTGIDNQLNSSGSVPPVQDPPGQVSVKFNQSTLQTFPPSAPQGKITAGSGPPRDADITFSNPRSGEQQPTAGWLKAFTVAAYQPYFNVDTSDILDRIKDSLFPFNGTFSEKTAISPDLLVHFDSLTPWNILFKRSTITENKHKSSCINILEIEMFLQTGNEDVTYGPFWICTTLIFVSASIGTSVTYLADRLHNKKWDYDIHLLTWSASLLYGYALIVPIILYILLKYISAPLGLVQILCLYGYSLFVFIPAVCLSIIPVEIFRWMVAGVAGFMSAMFVASNLRSHIVTAGERWFWIVAGITLLQLALSIVLKIYLFSVTV